MTPVTGLQAAINTAPVAGTHATPPGSPAAQDQAPQPAPPNPPLDDQHHPTDASPTERRLPPPFTRPEPNTGRPGAKSPSTFQLRPQLDPTSRSNSNSDPNSKPAATASLSSSSHQPSGAGVKPAVAPKSLADKCTWSGRNLKLTLQCPCCASAMPHPTPPPITVCFQIVTSTAG